MKGVDLAQFQFDYDLEWAALFLHADGTVFARHGVGGVGGADATESLAALRETMRRVLDAHRGYPDNRARFAPKRGPTPAVRFARDFAWPALRRAAARPTSRKQCVHCHNIYDGMHHDLRSTGDYDPDRVWKYPPPEGLGFSVDAFGDRVTVLRPDSAAAAGGLVAGDRLVSVDGHAILSAADVRFALHHAGEARTIPVRVARDDESVDLSITPTSGWRRSDLTWRGSMWSMPPQPKIWMKTMAPAEKRRRGIAPDALAVVVRGVFGPVGRRAGLRVGDVVVAYDGRREHRTAEALHVDMRLRHYRPGATVALEVVRGDERVAVTLVFDE